MDTNSGPPTTTLCSMRVFNVTCWPVDPHPRFMRGGLYFSIPTPSQNLSSSPHTQKVKQAISLSHLSLSNTHTQVAFVYARQQMAAHYWADRVVIWHAPCHPLHPHPTLHPSPSCRRPALEQRGRCAFRRESPQRCVFVHAHARVCNTGLWPFGPI